MSECLPYERFKWLKNINEFDVMSIKEKSPIVYFLEVDLEYSDKLHWLQKNLLFQVIRCQNVVKKLLINMR